MNKAVYFKSSGKEFGVTSVVVPAGTKGFIYLEALNEPAVRAAINGLRGVSEPAIDRSIKRYA